MLFVSKYIYLCMLFVSKYIYIHILFARSFLIICTEEIFLNLVNLNQIWIAITLFRIMTRHKTEFCSVPNQSEKCKYNP